ncbi:MAG: MGDG synthase family glycosyltransferase [Terriglobia bacterium]
MPKILILTVSHGAAHRRAGEALRAAFEEIQPASQIEVIDALKLCARWFHAYYDSYIIPLRYWPGLWRWLESYQHRQPSTGPGWLYRAGSQPLRRYLQAENPDIVIATEVGTCELVTFAKRSTSARFFLTALELMDFNRAWVQPEIDFYPVVHPDLGEELAQSGAPREKILACGMPIHPAFSRLPERDSTRLRLGLRGDLPLLLVLFGGTGFGNPGQIVRELKKVQTPLQMAFVSGRNSALEKELRRLLAGVPNACVLGWVDKMHEWMVAADLLLSKPGGASVMEAAACRLPLLAFDPLPGNEERTCRWLEKWQIGVWLRSSAEIAPVVERLLTNREEQDLLARRAGALARPRAAFDVAAEILKRWSLLSCPSDSRRNSDAKLTK